MMRRHEREIKDREEIDAIIQRAQVCRIGLSEFNQPYIVPMNFGFDANCLYFHSAIDGKKLDMIRQNSNVCFEMDIDYEMVKSTGRPCTASARYRCVMGTGKAVVIEGSADKSRALNIIMQHYGIERCDFTEKELERVRIIKIEIGSMTGKKAGY
jgi:nitroimidazol reductase NimA-like FMN-containing flavoprotein (pyridoxamine 5'-phosphate oxidase superfamily)